MKRASGIRLLTKEQLKRANFLTGIQLRKTRMKMENPRDHKKVGNGVAKMEAHGTILLVNMVDVLTLSIMVTPESG